ncbi:MAG TPA: aldo/keto reductase, partial [Rhizomicrobium sp.]|nr:aldo/keto reductase [Rhizomicrobium sp.]
QAMLAQAAAEGVAVLDTAANYGQAEEVLAQCDTSAFRIVSKTVSVKNGVAAAIARASQSVRSLGRVDVLLVHAVADLLKPDGDALWRALRDLKEQRTVGAVGISAYVADDPATLARRFRPDVMQIPFSLLDQRLLQDGSLARLKDLGMEIHARSLFLQGLLFMETMPVNLRDAAPLLNRVRQRIAAAHTTPLAAALGFVLSRPEVDVAVVGATSRHELDEILAAARAPLPELEWAACALDDARILTPSLW